MSLDDLAKLSDFISELEDLCKERSIGFMDGIPAPMEGCGGWWVSVKLEVGDTEESSSHDKRGNQDAAIFD